MKRILSIIVLSLSMLSVYSQELTLKFDHTAIPVSDLNTSSQFYAEILFLEAIPTPGNNPILKWFDLGNNHQLHLIKERTADLRLSKSVHFSLSVNDLGAFIAHLNVHDIEFSDWLGEYGTVSKRPDGVRQIYIQDPDGHWIEINDARY